jgi:hypothetical protein
MATTDLPSIILLVGALWYIGHYVWIYRLSTLFWGYWHHDGTEGGLTKLFTFLGVLSMTVATTVMFSSYVLFVDDSKTVYTQFIFALIGPAIDTALDIFPSRGALVFIVSLVLFALTKTVQAQQAYFVTALIIIGVSSIGVALEFQRKHT